MPDRSSAFFFLGRLEPTELANFNVQNVFLPDEGAVMELFGHAISIWWSSRPRNEFPHLRARAADWVTTFASAYYLDSGVPLEVRLVGWVEALDVVAEEAVIGIIDPRFQKVEMSGEEEGVNDAARAAIDLAIRLRGRLHLEAAAHEALAAANDPSDGAFLSAYRALECIRRTREDPAVPGDRRRKDAWLLLRESLDPSEIDSVEALTEAAKAVRHADRPTVEGEHPVLAARTQRGALIRRTAEIVHREIAAGLD